MTTQSDAARVISFFEDGMEIPDIGEMLDNMRTRLARRVYTQTGFPVGDEMRSVVAELEGFSECQEGPSEQCDTLNIPFYGGTLIIERPWMNLEDCSYQGHRVSCLRVIPPFRELVKFIEELLEQERMKSKQLFLETSQRYPPEELQELAKLFDKA